MDCSLLGSSVHGILQARILEWVAISFSRGGTHVSCGSCIGRQILYQWVTSGAPFSSKTTYIYWFLVFFFFKCGISFQSSYLLSPIIYVFIFTDNSLSCMVDTTLLDTASHYWLMIKGRQNSKGMKNKQGAYTAGSCLTMLRRSRWQSGLVTERIMGWKYNAHGVSLLLLKFANEEQHFFHSILFLSLRFNPNALILSTHPRFIFK